MSLRLIGVCALLGIQAFLSIANPVLSDTTEELVSTPGGLVPKSRVHAVPESARVHHTGSEVHIVASDGTTIHSTPVTKGNSPVAKLFGEPSSVASRDLAEGYVAYSYWNNTGKSQIASFTTSYVVPPIPKTTNDQILYFFNGLVPNSFDGIFQPVLQFGVSPAGGGLYYAVASWFIVGFETYYTTPVKVQPGQTITGVMTFEGTTGSGSSEQYKWNSIFSGIPTSSLSISTTEVYNWIYEVLEIYYVSTASELPTGTTTMTNIQIMTQDGQHPSMLWGAISDPGDSISMSIISGTSTNGTMMITYPVS
ncbi:hypothetical protein CPB84DRAFT_1849348 [Gymnopilus junonius]|uniref:Uncharacterized protein n=1 Tax=Gymnopilus junonius TaxID=109634 RepID=A0A9P5TJU0_GYMJU|nr:hypothetical protein CPB84DRAFT_1849348 [Gymnopilus junonius]